MPDDLRESKSYIDPRNLTQVRKGDKKRPMKKHTNGQITNKQIIKKNPSLFSYKLKFLI